MNIAKSNVFFEGQKIYVMHRKEILTAHHNEGKAYRYVLERNENILTIRSLQGKAIAEIVVIDKDDITVMTDKNAWQGNKKVEIFACSDDDIAIQAEN